jgi:hypothetical protein
LQSGRNGSAAEVTETALPGEDEEAGPAEMDIMLKQACMVRIDADTKADVALLLVSICRAALPRHHLADKSLAAIERRS